MDQWVEWGCCTAYVEQDGRAAREAVSFFGWEIASVALFILSLFQEGGLVIIPEHEVLGIAPSQIQNW